MVSGPRGCREMKQMSNEQDRADKFLRAIDRVDWTPDYAKTPEEDAEIMACRYRKAYGEWPPWMPEGLPEEPKEE